MLNLKKNQLRQLNLLLSVIILTYIYRLTDLFVSGAWSDRAQFFGDGLHAPNLFDMINNEIISSVVLVMIVVGNFHWLFGVYFLLGSLVFFTRAGIFLLILACIVSQAFSNRVKLQIILLGCVASLIILLIRFAGVVPTLDDFILFYLTYPLVGIGRLMETNFDSGVNYLQSLTLIFRPFGVFTYIYDYLLGLDGSASFERYAGEKLSTFEYSNLLNGYYNAFGTLLYPYFLAFGPYLGFCAFFISFILYYLSVSILFGKHSAIRICMYILISGILFSWVAPFFWAAPFIIFALKKTSLIRLN